MRLLVAIISIATISFGSLHASIMIFGKEEMIAQSELIAIVEIQELVTTDKTKTSADLIASGHVSRILKGYSKGEIVFRIPRFFPCASFDVSTGRHIVFLKKNGENEYVGVNWYMSYLYMGGKTSRWFDDMGSVIDRKTPIEVINEVEGLLDEFSDKSLHSDGDERRRSP